MTHLTLDQLMRAVAHAKQHAIKPKVVKTVKQARKMTKADPLGQEWRKGDEYYVLTQMHGDRNIKVE